MYSQREWDIMLDCLRDYLEYIKDTQPYAINDIRMLDEVLFLLPEDVEEAFSDLEV